MNHSTHMGDTTRWSDWLKRLKSCFQHLFFTRFVSMPTAENGRQNNAANRSCTTAYRLQLNGACWWVKSPGVPETGWQTSCALNVKKYTYDSKVIFPEMNIKQFSPHDTATRYMKRCSPWRMVRRSLAKHSNNTCPTLAAVGSNNKDVLMEQRELHSRMSRYELGRRLVV